MRALMELPAIRLSEQTTLAKSLVVPHYNQRLGQRILMA